MKIKIVLKACCVLFLLASLAFIYLANRDISKIYGGLTERVDPKQFNAIDGKIIIENVNILANDGQSFLADKSVTLEHGHITEIANNTIESTGATLIDGAGKFLIPGLSDTHVHLFKSPNDLLLYLANGVTQVRELIGEDDHLQWRSEIENGRLGPDLFIASPRIGSFELLEGWFMEWSQGFLNISTAADAVREVNRLHQQGYDAVKIYSQINKETYDAVTQTARPLGMKVVGHIPWSIGIADILAHQDSVAHLEELMNALNREFGKSISATGFGSKTADEFLSYVNKRSDEVAETLRDNDIAVSTTLWLVESFVRQKFELEQVLSEVELAYENPGISEWTPNVPQGGLGWLPGVNRYFQPGELTAEQAAGRRKYWETYAQACQIILKSLLKNQVKVMTGTDANLPPTVPGFSLHDEFVSLKKAGMTNAQILKAATQTPADWLDSNAGRIVPGFKANLVLLDKNPLVDIEHTKAINAVIVSGKLLKRSTLDNILRSVKAANDASRSRDISDFHQH